MRPAPALVMFLLLASAAAHGAGIPGGVPWGASMARVLAAQPGTVIVRTGERLITHDRLASLPVAVTYRFRDGGLDAVSVLNRARHADRNEYIDDCVRLRRGLAVRWGEPYTDERAWRNDLFRERRERWGDAVAAGHLVYRVAWRSGGTGVVMTLASERLQVSHEVVYRRRPAAAGDG